MTEPQPARVVLTHPAGWIASGFGVGLAPRAAGTFGSLAALVPWWLWLRHLPLAHYLGVVALAFAIGIWAGNWVIARTRIEDPGVVVWDEFIGQWLALLLAPAGVGLDARRVRVVPPVRHLEAVAGALGRPRTARRFRHDARRCARRLYALGVLQLAAYFLR